MAKKAVELAAASVGLSFTYGDSLKGVGKAIADVAKTAEEEGRKGGRRLSLGLLNEMRRATPEVRQQLASQLAQSTGLISKSIGEGMVQELRAAGEKAGRAAGDGARAGAKKSGGGAGSELAAGLVGSFSGVVKTGMAAVLPAVGIGAILSKGFDRLSAIDDAKAKLRGLGMDAGQVQSALDAALAAVKGTAYGIDEAATAASGALASGIQPGEDLTRFLTLTGDAAAQAGIDFDHMAQIMNKIQGQGKLTGETLQQLTENGLYAAPMLAKALGVPQDQMAKMASEGQISAAKFQEVLQSNIGGAALRMGETVSGSTKNAGAAISRLGAALLQPAFAVAPQILGGITKGVDSLTGIVAEKMGPITNRVTDFVSGLLESKEANGLFQDMGGVVASAMPQVQEFLGKIGDVVKDVVPHVVEFGRAFIDNVKSGFEAIKPSIAAVGGGLKTVGETILGVFRRVAPAVTDLATKLLPSLRTAGTSIAQAFGKIFPVVAQIFRGVMAVLGPVVSFLLKAAGVVIPVVVNVVSWLIRAIGNVIGWLGNLGSTWDRVWAAIKSVISGAWAVIKAPFDLWIGVMKLVGEGAMWLWTNAIVPAWNGIKSAIETGWGVIKGILDVFRNAWTQVGEWVSTAFDKVVNFVTSMPGRIKAAAVGMWDGIKDSFKAVINAVIDIWNGVKFPSVTIAGKEIGGWSLPQIPHFAGGGMLSGPGGPRSDSIPLMASNGEFLVNSASTSRWLKLLQLINSGAGTTDVLRALLPGFADGGLLGKVKSQLAGLNGVRYQMGGFSGAGIDCSGLVSVGANLLAGRAPFAERMSTTTEGPWLKKLGWQEGLGPEGSARIGWYDRGGGANGHTAGTLPDGTNFESSSGKGVVIGSGARGATDSLFDRHMYLPLGPQMPGSGGSGGGGFSGLSGGGSGSGGGFSGGGGSGGGGGGDNPYSKIQDGISQLLPDFGSLADIGSNGLKESLLPPGFEDPFNWPMVKSGAALMKWLGGLRNENGFLLGDAAPALSIGGAALTGSGSDVVNAVKGIVPKPFGDQQSGSPKAAADSFDPVGSPSGGVSLGGVGDAAMSGWAGQDQQGGNGTVIGQQVNVQQAGMNANDVRNSLRRDDNMYKRGTATQRIGAG